MNRAKTVTAVGGLALALVAGACDDDRTEVSFTPATRPSPSLVESLPAGFPADGAAVKDAFVGLARGANEIGVAFVRRGDEVAVYLCDGRSISDWFAGKLDGDRLRLQSAEGTKLDAKLSAGGVSGTFTLGDGKPVHLTHPLPSQARPGSPSVASPTGCSVGS